MDDFVFEKIKLKPVDKPRAHSLSQGFAALNNSGHNESEVFGMNSSGTHDADQYSNALTQDILLSISASASEHDLDSDVEPKSIGEVSEKKLRAGGESPRPPSFLKGYLLPPILRAARRRAKLIELANRPDFYRILKTSCVAYNGHHYLPLTAWTFKELPSLWGQSELLADLRLFEKLLIEKESNTTHADHVFVALERVGRYCQDLIIKFSVKTPGLGDVFYQEQSNVGTDNDWMKAFRALPNLITITIIDVSAAVSRPCSERNISAITAALIVTYEGKRIPTTTLVQVTTRRLLPDIE